ncbi:MAG: leucine-rich repeat protein [Clostridia bacterium]|nr:leucine-rich repeat protein [Clostridia bacterium]
MPEVFDKVCSVCKFVFTFPAGQATFECPACGTANGRPISTGTTLGVLTRATRQRLNRSFSEAEQSYLEVLRTHPDEHEALWGRLLCKYCVEYVRMSEQEEPTIIVHSTRGSFMTEEGDFDDACRNAPPDVRAQYERDARTIDSIMTNVITLAQDDEPYDVFLCLRTERVDGTGRTEDYEYARNLYRMLTDAGRRVFFAPETIPGVTGPMYEAAVFHGLDTAKVMLVICSNSEYVRSERVSVIWRRYLERKEQDGRITKSLVPLLYGRMTREQLPGEMLRRHLHCIPMEQQDAMRLLMASVQKYAGDADAVSSLAGGGPWEDEDDDAGELPEDFGQETVQDDDVLLLALENPDDYSPAGDFETQVVEDGCAIRHYHGADPVVLIPPVIGGRRVVRIGDNAFEQCEFLQEVVVPSGVQRIGSGAFWNCSSLMRIWLPDTVRDIRAWAFHGCSALQTITLPQSLEIIRESAFGRCFSLTELTLPESVKTICDGAFGECRNLLTVAMPSGSLSISDNAFSGCLMVVLQVMDNSQAHQYAARMGLATMPIARPEYYVMDYADGCALARYTGRGGVVSVPETLDGLYVRHIDAGAFRGCTALTALTLPETLLSIGDNAFESCTGLQRVTLSGNLESIGAGAFMSCTSLEELTLPETVESIGRQAFLCCTSLKQFTPGAHLAAIGDEAFWGCTSLETILLPEALRSVGQEAFSGCTSLQELTLPEGVMSIGEHAFRGCGALQLRVKEQTEAHRLLMKRGVPCVLLRQESNGPEREFSAVEIPGGCAVTGYTGQADSVRIPEEIDGKAVLRIADCAFERREQLECVDIPEGLKELGLWAFRGCANLRQVGLPASLQIIGDGVFEGCTSLKKLTIPEGTAEISSHAFFGCPGVTLNVTAGAPAHTFAARSGLTFVMETPADQFRTQEVPDGCEITQYLGGAACVSVPAEIGGRAVASIGRNAFAGCGTMAEIVLPASVTRICEYAFFNCGELRSVRLPEKLSSVGAWAFHGCKRLGVVRVPVGLAAVGESAFSACPAVKLQVSAGSPIIPYAEKNGLQVVLEGAVATFRTKAVPGGCAIVRYEGREKQVVVPPQIDGNQVVSLADSAFAGCQVEQVTLPEGLRELRERVFAGCPSLKMVRLPQTLRAIRDRAFEGCISLRRLSVPGNVTIFGADIFSGCTSLNLLVARDSAADQYARKHGLSVKLAGMPEAPGGFRRMETAAGCVIVRYEGRDKSVTVPAELGGKPVTGIGDRAFEGCQELEQVVLPEGVTSVGERAFYSCAALRRVTIPASVKTFGGMAFAGCPQVTLLVKKDSPAHVHAEQMSYNCTLVDREAPPVVFHVEPAGEGLQLVGYRGRDARVSVPARIDGKPVVSVGKKAFSQSAGVTEIVLPEGVTEIADSAFWGCGSLERIVLPGSVRKIGESAFWDCRQLKELTLPDGMTHLETWLLRDCRELRKVKLPAGLRSIGNRAFEGCAALEQLDLPEGLRSIGEEAFVGCVSLHELEIPENTADIGRGAFDGCPTLTLLVADGSTAHAYAQRCGIACSAAKKTFRTALIRGGCEIVVYDGADARVDVPGRIDGKLVVRIGERAFEKCAHVTEVILPASVQQIGEAAFSGCLALKRVVLPERVSVVENWAFRGCRSLQSMTLPDTVQELADNVFSGCTGLAKITLPDGMTTIGVRAFQGCSSLKDLKLPSALTCVGSDAFSGCSALTEVCVPAGVTKIGRNAFARCPLLKLKVCEGSAAQRYAADAGIDCEVTGSPVTFPARDVAGGCELTGYHGKDTRVSVPAVLDGKPVVRIGEDAFARCADVERVELPDSVKEIGARAFLGCGRLRELRLPAALTAIGESAFDSCGDLAALTIPASVTRIGACAFEDCIVLKLKVFYHSSAHEYAKKNGIGYDVLGAPAVYETTDAADGCVITRYRGHDARVTVPQKIGGKAVVGIGAEAFRGRLDVELVELPEGVRGIGARAFQDCGRLRGVKLPESLTDVGVEAFGGCRMLSTLTLGMGVKNIGRNAFRGCAALKLRVTVMTPAHEYARQNGIPCHAAGGQEYETELVRGGCALKRYLGNSTSVSIPPRIDGRIVVKIGDGAFDGQGGLAEVLLPGTVREIGQNAFRACRSLRRVYMPDGLTAIGEGAFQGCAALADLDVPASVMTIGAKAFAGCPALKLGVTSCSAAHQYVRENNLLFRVTGDAAPGFTADLTEKGCIIREYTQNSTRVRVPDQIGGRPVVAIGDRAFLKKRVEKVHLPESVVTVGDFAFSGCSTLTDIVLPQGLSHIGMGAFDGCTRLKLRTLPLGVTELSARLFSGCVSLQSMTLPADVRRIGANAFASCTELTELILPEGLKEIGPNMLRGCGKLQSLKLPAGLEKIDANAFALCTGLQAVVEENTYAHQFVKGAGLSFTTTSAPETDFIVKNRPDGCAITGYIGKGGVVIVPMTIGGKTVVEIGDSAFEKCTTLTAVKLPEGVTELARDAFYGCTALQSAHMPETLTEIGPRAFGDCGELKKLNIPGSVKKIGKKAFDGCVKLPEDVRKLAGMGLFGGLF